MAQEKSILAAAQTAAQKLLTLINIPGEVSVSEDKENETLEVQVETEEAGVLIGHHGETIGAFQLLLGQILHKRTGEWKRVLVNVGDWRERREETLKNLAKTVAERVKETGEPQPIYDLTPAERRIVHIELSQNSDVATESEGEGRERHLVVRPKKD